MTRQIILVLGLVLAIPCQAQVAPFVVAPTITVPKPIAYVCESDTASGAWSQIGKNITIPADSANRYLLIFVGGNGNTSQVDSVKFGTTKLTLLADTTEVVADNFMAFYGLANPASGTTAINVYTTGNTYGGFGAIVYCNVKQTDSYTVKKGLSGYGTTVSTDISSTATTDVVVDATYSGNGTGSAVAGANQTQRWDNGDHIYTGAPGYASQCTTGSEEAGNGGTVTMSWTVLGGDEHPHLLIALHRAD